MRPTIRPIIRSGFTLTEMIIVIGIMGVLATIGTQTYLRQRDEFVFNNALSRSLELIKTARNNAITSLPAYINETVRNVVPAEGYGVQFTLNPERGKSVLSVFANLGPGSDAAGFQHDDQPDRLDGNDKVLETFTLPSQVVFRSFQFDGVEQWNPAPEDPGPTARAAVVIFKPPLGEMELGDNNGTRLEELALSFQNPQAQPGSPKECQWVRIHRIKAFAEMEYGPCP